MTGFITDPLCGEHDTGAQHPECAARLRAVQEALHGAGLLAQLTKLTPRDATRAEAELCHEAAYLALAQREIEAGEAALSTGDTTVSAQSFAAALRACGSVLSAVDAVMTGQVHNAFCAVRPPGHHATANRGMGFCIINHLAVAARYAQRQHGVERVAILDWDVHHGNGTQDIFYEDGSVFYFSTHQWPLYPGTGLASERGRGAGAGTTLNCPFSAGAGLPEFRAAFTEQLAPALAQFRPQLVLLSAGFDAHAQDPLGDLRLSSADFAELTRIVGAMAKQHAGGRLVSMLEGGYNLQALGQAAAAHVEALRLLGEEG